jgi:hypothetical protein
MSTRWKYVMAALVGMTVGVSVLAGCEEPPHAPVTPYGGGRFALLHAHAGDEALILFGDHGCGPPRKDPTVVTGPVGERLPRPAAAQ